MVARAFNRGILLNSSGGYTRSQVDTKLETQVMDVACDRGDPIGETTGIDRPATILVYRSGRIEIPEVINIDILITGRLEICRKPLRLGFDIGGSRISAYRAPTTPTQKRSSCHTIVLVRDGCVSMGGTEVSQTGNGQERQKDTEKQKGD